MTMALAWKLLESAVRGEELTPERAEVAAKNAMTIAETFLRLFPEAGMLATESQEAKQ